MTIDHVIQEVAELQDDFRAHDGLSGEYALTVETNGDDWDVKFGGINLVMSEDGYDCEIPLKQQIIKAMRDISEYLNIVLGGR